MSQTQPVLLGLLLSSQREKQRTHQPSAGDWALQSTRAGWGHWLMEWLSPRKQRQPAFIALDGQGCTIHSVSSPSWSLSGSAPCTLPGTPAFPASGELKKAGWRGRQKGRKWLLFLNLLGGGWVGLMLQRLRWEGPRREFLGNRGSRWPSFLCQALEPCELLL